MHQRLPFVVIASAFFMLFGAGAVAQVIPDTDADLTIGMPIFAKDIGPRVSIDTAHNNYHTGDNRYRPFANLLRNDGFRVGDSSTTFTATSLKDVDLLVIANAVSKGETLETLSVSPFTDDEIVVVKDWVRSGGALLLITDHPPFSGAAGKIASALGFEVDDGFAVRAATPDDPDVFTQKDGSLRPHPITQGRSQAENVSSLTTFGGCSMRVPEEAQPLAVFPVGYQTMKIDSTTQKPVPFHSAEGLSQGAVLAYGKGRLAVFCEAGMFSAQIITTPKRMLFGFNAPSAPENKQFILNLVRWLTHAN
jgi:hypothetical protein